LLKRNGMVRLSQMLEISGFNAFHSHHISVYPLLVEDYFEFIPFLKPLEIYRPTIQISKLVNQIGAYSLLHHIDIHRTCDGAPLLMFFIFSLFISLIEIYIIQL